MTPVAEQTDPLRSAVEDGTLDRDAFERTRKIYVRSKRLQFGHALKLSAQTFTEAIDAASHAAEADDTETIAQAMHEMKASAGQLGAIALREHAIAIETAARDGGVDRERLAALPELLERWREIVVAHPD